MTKKIVAVNAGPRKGWNTDTLIKEAARGAEEAGATVEYFDLFKLEKYTGCISCFGCKKEKKYTFYPNGMVKTMEYSPGKNHKVTYKYNKKGLLTERINGAVTESVKYNYSNGLVSKITYHENDEESTEVYKITYSKQKVDAKKYAAIMSNLALWNSMNLTYYESLYVK